MTAAGRLSRLPEESASGAGGRKQEELQNEEIIWDDWEATGGNLPDSSGREWHWACLAQARGVQGHLGRLAAKA